jgi:hypothetical protein
MLMDGTCRGELTFSLRVHPLLAEGNTANVPLYIRVDSACGFCRVQYFHSLQGDSRTEGKTGRTDCRIVCEIVCKAAHSGKEAGGGADGIRYWVAGSTHGLSARDLSVHCFYRVWPFWSRDPVRSGVEATTD